MTTKEKLSVEYSKQDRFSCCSFSVGEAFRDGYSAAEERARVLVETLEKIADRSFILDPSWAIVESLKALEQYREG